MAVDLPNAYTLLTLAGIGEAPYAMRGLDMQFEPIEQSGQLLRNINGGFVNLADPMFRKYRITINCTDQRAPPFGGLWAGQKVLLGSAIELGQVSLSSDRAAVSGSTNTEDGVTYFRPQLKCRVMSFDWGGNEYSLELAWSLVLEETTDADFAGS